MRNKPFNPPNNIYIANDGGDGTCVCGSSLKRKFSLFFFRIGKKYCVNPGCNHSEFMKIQSRYYNMLDTQCRRGDRPDYNKICDTAHALLTDPQLGFVSSIETPIQDVGEYELVLTLRFRK